MVWVEWDRGLGGKVGRGDAWSTAQVQECQGRGRVGHMPPPWSLRWGMVGADPAMGWQHSGRISRQLVKCEPLAALHVEVAIAWGVCHRLSEGVLTPWLGLGH